MSQKTLQIRFPAAERSANPGDPRLYSVAEIPCLDMSDEGYSVILTVSAADPEQERVIADTCTGIINAANSVKTVMQAAYDALDSVAFLRKEGDADAVKQALADHLGGRYQGRVFAGVDLMDVVSLCDAIIHGSPKHQSLIYDKAALLREQAARAVLQGGSRQ